MTNILLIAWCKAVSVPRLSFPGVHAIGLARSILGVFRPHVVVKVFSDSLLLAALIIGTYGKCRYFDVAAKSLFSTNRETTGENDS